MEFQKRKRTRRPLVVNRKSICTVGDIGPIVSFSSASTLSRDPLMIVSRFSLVKSMCIHGEWTENLVWNRLPREGKNLSSISGPLAGSCKSRKLIQTNLRASNRVARIVQSNIGRRKKKSLLKAVRYNNIDIYIRAGSGQRKWRLAGVRVRELYSGGGRARVLIILLLGWAALRSKNDALLLPSIVCPLS